MIERRIFPDGSSACQVYRAYLVNADGHFVNVVELYCRNDEEASEEARRLAVYYSVELWNKDRLLSRIPAPPLPRNPRSES